MGQEWNTSEFEFLTKDGPTELTGSSYLREVARGNVVGGEIFSAFGERTTSGAETNRVIWPNGVFSIPAASGVQMSIVSTSADDAADGTNIRTIDIHYLDINLDPQTERVTLNGLTPVLTVATDIRFIQCVHIVTFGTTASAAGDIIISNGGTTYSQIAAGAVRCSSSARMVPRGKRLLVTGAVGSSISGTGQARAVIRLCTTELTSQSFVYPLILIPHASIGVQDGAVSHNFDTPFIINEGNIIAMTHTTDKSATISGSWFGFLENA